jgi:hypothetical protein
MDEQDQVFRDSAAMTPEKIIAQFKKVFDRDMTPAKRKSFFLPADSPERPK